MRALNGLYHPGKLDAESFIFSFILWLKEFERIMDNLKGQSKKPLQHFLITGKRGMGKSTMLRRIYLEAKTEPYRGKLSAVHLGSEQYKISRLYKLWEEVITILSVEDECLNKKREELAITPHYEEYIIQIITDYLNKQNKTLLLLIDNFGQLINKFTPKEQHEFREVLIQHPIQIIGSTVFYNSNFFKYDKPFYDFFKEVNLKNLDKKESELFIHELAKIRGMEDFEETLKSQKGKIETLRILSGGVPRTLVILLIILSKKNTGDSIDSLNEILEMVTPLYQDRMNALSSQQQEIMHHLAKHWDRVPVKKLAKDTRIPSKSISAQLSQLEEGGYINKVRTSKRNYFYEIEERFFNIWLLMNEFSTYDGKRVMWLTKWLDLFYDSKELEEYTSFPRLNMMSSKPNNGVARENEQSIYREASFYYEKNDINKKTRALEILDSVVKNSPQTVNDATIKIKVLLWNENINTACHEFESMLEEFEGNDSAFWAISDILLAFLTFKQRQFLFKQFSEIRPLLKDQYKPIYFAFLMEMKLELPDEYLKTPGELVETVNNLLESVNKKRRLLNLD